MDSVGSPPPERNPEGPAAPRPSWQSRPGRLTVCILLGAATFGVDVVLPWGAATSMLYAVAVLISSRSLSRQFTVLVAMVGSLLTILGFFFSPSGGILWMALVNRALVLGLLWGITLFSFPRSGAPSTPARMPGPSEAPRTVEKNLRGFLPICASCKNVRDDDGAWHQIEVYISEYSDAEFTHSICPDCIRRLYPGHG